MCSSGRLHAVRHGDARGRGRRLAHIRAPRITSTSSAPCSSCIGIVIQDVVADAMCDRGGARARTPTATPRPKEEVDRELGMVQVLGGSRCRSASGRGRRRPDGSRASCSRDRVSAGPDHSGHLDQRRAVDHARSVERRPTDWRILGGGIALRRLGAGAGAWLASRSARSSSSFCRWSVICTMLVVVTRDLDRATRRSILFTQHHYLRVSLDADGRRWLFLVDARRAQVRSGLLRDAAADSARLSPLSPCGYSASN